MTQSDPIAGSEPPSSKISSDSRYGRAAHTAWRRIGDETVVLDPVGRRLLGLNDAGSAVWHQLDSPRTAAELAAESGLRAGDVTAFLERLLAWGLAELASRSAGEVEAGWVEQDPAADGAAPAILWQEPLQNAAQSSGGCAFLSGQNPLCNSAPFS